MESQEQVNFEVLLLIENCEIYSIQMYTNPPQNRLIASGTLRAIFNPNIPLYCLQIEDFKYSLSNELPTARLNPGQFTLPGADNEIYGLNVKQPFDEETVTCLEDFIDEHSNLVIQKKTLEPGVQVLEGANENIQEQQQIQVQQEGKINKTQKAKNFLYNAGKKAQHYINIGAQKSAVYINQGVVYAKKKIKTKETPTQISSGTKQKLAAAKSGSKIVFQMTSTAVKGLIAGAESIIKELGEKWENSEKGKELQQKEAYQSAKEVTKATVNFLATTYDALFDAAVLMTKEVGTGVVEIVDHRYGQEASQVTKDGLQSAGNIALVFQDTKQQVAQSISKNTEEKKTAIQDKP